MSRHNHTSDSESDNQDKYGIDEDDHTQKVAIDAELSLGTDFGIK